jgi:hypothetical protein
MAISPIDQKIAAGTYKELEEGLTGGSDDRGEWETKCYLTLWGDRSTFLRELKGTTRTSGGSSGTWSTVTPYQLPDNPSLYARDATFVPEGALVPGITPIRWTHAKFTVNFRKLDFNFQATDDPGGLNSISQDATENAALLYATQELEWGKEWVTLPNAACKFKSDGKLINSSMSRSISIITMNLTWHRYPVMPMDLCRRFADSVNDATFLGCDVGTVLFDGPTTVREAADDGTVTQKVRMTFRWREFDWNKRLREDGFSWDKVVDKAYTSGSDAAFVNYPYRDFSTLLLGKGRQERKALGI